MLQVDCIPKTYAQIGQFHRTKVNFFLSTQEVCPLPVWSTGFCVVDDCWFHSKQTNWLLYAYVLPKRQNFQKSMQKWIILLSRHNWDFWANSPFRWLISNSWSSGKKNGITECQRNKTNSISIIVPLSKTFPCLSFYFAFIKITFCSTNKEVKFKCW